MHEEQLKRIECQLNFLIQMGWREIDLLEQMLAAGGDTTKLAAILADVKAKTAALKAALAT